MRLIVHLGFHKTGSTYLQHLLNKNSEALTDVGIWYEKQEGYPAHHFTAWALLMGDAARLTAMLAAARDAGCHTAILSSEDLEAVPFNPQVARLIEQTAQAAGVTELEWHIALREPGAYFASLHAQLHHHVCADSLAMLTEVMRKGALFIPDPLPGGGGTPYWFYSFDHHRTVATFARTTPHPVIVHDFADADPYPGWRLIERLGAADALTQFPDQEARNARCDEVAVATGMCQRVLEALDDASEALMLAPWIEQSLRANLAAVPVFADSVGRRFGASYRAAIREFGTAGSPDLAMAG
jgi:hypothetical protein